MNPTATPSQLDQMKALLAILPNVCTVAECLAALDNPVRRVVLHCHGMHFHALAVLNDVNASERSVGLVAVDVDGTVDCNVWFVTTDTVVEQSMLGLYLLPDPSVSDGHDALQLTKAFRQIFDGERWLVEPPSKLAQRYMN